MYVHSQQVVLPEPESTEFRVARRQARYTCISSGIGDEFKLLRFRFLKIQGHNGSFELKSLLSQIISYHRKKASHKITYCAVWMWKF
jgi:hypothetical protein